MGRAGPFGSAPPHADVRTEGSWRGCCEVIVKLNDGFSHAARFHFGT